MSSAASKKPEEKSKIPKPVKTVVPKLRGGSGSPKLNLIRKAAYEELINLIGDSISGLKTLVLDPSIIGTLALIMSLTSLKSKDVDDVIRKIDGNAFETQSECIVFIARPRVEVMKSVAKMIQAMKMQDKKKIYLVLVPRRTLICEIVLERAGVYSLIEKPILECGLDLIPFDNSLLSMEIPYGFRELYLEGDTSPSNYIARALMKVQAIYGKFPLIRYCGSESERVTRILTDLKERTGDNLPNVMPEFSELILIDRAVDLVTPLMTQLTYEGLIDELYGINNNLLSLDFLKDGKSATPPIIAVPSGQQEQQQPVQQQQQQQPPKRPKKMPLNDDDVIFADVRHRHFLSVGPCLKNQAKKIEAEYEERKKLSSSDVKAIKEFMTKLPFLTQKHEDLTTHVNIATEIKRETSSPDFRKMIEIQQNIIGQVNDKQTLEYIEDCIIRQDPLPKVMRLLCLYCVVRNGLPAKEFDSLRKELVHSYGHFILLTLNNLEEASLFFKQGTKKRNLNWSRVFKPLELFDQNLDEKQLEPKSIHYVHSGYAPLSVRLVELARTVDGWLNKVKPLLEKDGFPVGDKHQIRDEGVAKDKDDKSVLVFLVGGCTFAEISAIRLLGERREISQKVLKYKYVVGTSKLINGNTLLTSLFENLSS